MPTSRNPHGKAKKESDMTTVTPPQPYAVLQALRQEQRATADQNEQKAYSTIASAEEAWVQQSIEATLAAGLATGSKSFLVDSTKVDTTTQGKLQAAVQKVAQADRDMKTQQDEIEKQKKLKGKAERVLKELEEEITGRQKALKTAQERVAKLRNEAMAAARSTASDAALKMADIYYELEEAAKDLATEAARATDPAVVQGIKTELTNLRTAQDKIDTATREQKRITEQRKVDDEQRKRLGR